MTTTLFSNNDSLSNLTLDIDFDADDNLNDLPRIKYSTHVLLGIIGVCMCLFGIFGNIVSIIVLTKQTMNKLSTYAYLVALSVCDAVGLLFTIIALIQYSFPPGSIIPNWMITTYPMILVYVYPIVSASQVLSVWITLAFTVDRYLYVCKPYLGNKVCTRRTSFYVICFLYIFSIIYSIPQFFERKYETIYVLKKYFVVVQYLTEFGKSKTYFHIYHFFIYAIFIFLIPFGTIAILNSFLIHNIMKSNKRHRDLHINILKNHSISYALVESTCPPLVKRAKMFYNKKRKSLFSCNKAMNSVSNNNINEQEIPLKPSNNGCLSPLPKSPTSSHDLRQPLINDIKYYDKSYRNDVTVLLIGLVIVFMICHFPSTILRLITVKGLKIMYDPVYITFLDISNFLIVFNATINCVLYVMLGKKFRKEFLRTICPNCYLKKTSTQIYLRRLSYFRNNTINNNNQNNHVVINKDNNNNNQQQEEHSQEAKSEENKVNVEK